MTMMNYYLDACWPHMAHSYWPPDPSGPPVFHGGRTAWQLPLAHLPEY